MQEFIRHHMMSILHPVAQHVREVQLELHTLGSDFSSLSIGWQQNRQLIDDQDCQLKLVHAKTDELNRRMDLITNAWTKMTDVTSSRYSVEEELSSARKNSVHIQDSTEAMKGFRKRLDTIESSIQAIQVGMIKTEGDVTEQAASLTRLNECYEGVNYRNIDLARELENFGQANAATTRALKKVTATADQQREEESKNIARLADHANSIEELVNECNKSTLRLDDRIKTLESDSRRLESALEHEAGVGAKLEVVQRSQSEMFNVVKEHGKSLLAIDERVVDLKKEVLAEKKSCAVQSRDLQSKIDGNVSAVGEVQELVHTHSTEIAKVDRLANDLLRDYRGLRDLSDGSLKDIRNLINAQKEHACKIELHTMELNKTQSEMRETGSGLEESMRNLKSFKEDLGATIVNVSKLNSCYDSCTRNLQGLSRGFQDAYRHVIAGENGMLPPKHSLALVDRQLTPIRPSTAPSNRAYVRPPCMATTGRPTALRRTDACSPASALSPNPRSDTGAP
eukprot:TRINITY_DN49769_c0_g1_i1.p1 TRINITY_DN49769_c0_g1~~TRINITY_DN49769_c0_g1_i1.p1  ORF type:complete len:549 (+),score=93.77 TRINITY_DN49769_c0_g1_i1:118-1647(+)